MRDEKNDGVAMRFHWILRIVSLIVFRILHIDPMLVLSFFLFFFLAFRRIAVVILPWNSSTSLDCRIS